MSYGGIKGKPMDSSSYAGGGVLESDEVMREMYLSLAIGAVSF